MKLGIPAGKIRVIPNGVDTTQFRPSDRAAARVACGLPADGTILLSVGGVYDGKGHHFVLDALARLVDRYPRILYVMVGAEPPGDRYRRILERIIEARGLAKHVHFAGPRAHEELPQWYAAADLFCLATRSEGRANVLLESIACGIPVVTTNVGGNPEIVRDGRDGFLVPFGDTRALAAAIEHAFARRWDREDMVAYARGHRWELAAEHVLQEFGRLQGSASATTVQTAPSWRGRL
jgi:glycosyltransferase involved in cell wall biosynthesis